MMSSQTINYNDSADNYGLIIHTTVGVQYDVPWQKVHELLIKAAKITKGVIADKEPFVLEQGFEDLYPKYQINAYIKDVTSYSTINSDLHANIQVVFNEAKVNLQTPFVVSQEKG
jgi:small-conductance mechanosensitive channel